MFKAIVPNVAFIYVPYATCKVVGTKKPWAGLSLSQCECCFEEQDTHGAYLLCPWPGAFSHKFDLKLHTGGSPHTYSFPLPISQATWQHPSPVKSQLLSREQL